MSINPAPRPVLPIPRLAALFISRSQLPRELNYPHETITSQFNGGGLQALSKK